MLGDRLVEEVDVAKRRGPDHDPGGAGLERRLDRARSSAARPRPGPAPRRARRSARRARGSTGAPLRAPSRSTTCNARAPPSTHRRAASSGSASYIGALVEVARGSGARPCRRGCRSPAAGSCARPARRSGRRAGRRRARRSSRASADRVREDFSGWNWTPNTYPRATIVANRSPYSVVPTTSRSGRWGAPRTSARGRRRSRRPGSPSVSGDGALEADLVPADVRDPQAAGLAARVTSPRDQPEPVASARAPRSDRTAAACRGRSRAAACPRPRSSRISSSSPSSSRLRIASGNAPTPGSTSPSAARERRRDRR